MPWEVKAQVGTNTEWSETLKNVYALHDVWPHRSAVVDTKGSEQPGVGLLRKSCGHFRGNSYRARNAKDELIAPDIASKQFVRLDNLTGYGNWDFWNLKRPLGIVNYWNRSEPSYEHFGRPGISERKLHFKGVWLGLVTVFKHKPSTLSSDVSVHASFGGIGSITSNLVGLLYSPPLEQRGDEQGDCECADYNSSDGRPAVSGYSSPPVCTGYWCWIYYGVIGTGAVIFALFLPIGVGFLLWAAWYFYSGAIRYVFKRIAAYRKN